VQPLDPHRLIKLYEGHTDLQAQRLLEPWIGQRVGYGGAVNSVSSSASVRIRAGNGADVFLSFKNVWRDRVERLAVGDEVKVIGTIEGASRHLGGTVWLRECDFVDD
jgi:hypothetical protein